MRKTLGAVLAIAAGMAAMGGSIRPADAAAFSKPQLSGTSEVVEVRKRGGFRGNRGFRGHRSFRGNRGFSRHRGFRSHRAFRGRGYSHRRYGRGLRWGAPVVIGAYGYGYGNCSYLKRRALATGSRYWWRRYNACRYY